MKVHCPFDISTRCLLFRLRFLTPRQKKISHSRLVNRTTNVTVSLRYLILQTIFWNWFKRRLVSEKVTVSPDNRKRRLSFYFNGQWTFLGVISFSVMNWEAVAALFSSRRDRSLITFVTSCVDSTCGTIMPILFRIIHLMYCMEQHFSFWKKE